MPSDSQPSEHNNYYHYLSPSLYWPNCLQLLWGISAAASYMLHALPVTKGQHQSSEEKEKHKLITNKSMTMTTTLYSCHMYRVGKNHDF